MNTNPATVVVRVWLPDRPGALGAVASRIGGVRGDVMAIDVLERGGGRAVDELTVTLADGELVDLLVSEIGQVEGVDVEDVRPLRDDGIDRVVSAVTAARRLTEVVDPVDLDRVLCEQACAVLHADWVCVIEPTHGVLAAMCRAEADASEPPEVSWLAALVGGLTPADTDTVGTVDELVVVRLGSGSSLVLARTALPLRAVECTVLVELARIADIVSAPRALDRPA